MATCAAGPRERTRPPADVREPRTRRHDSYDAGPLRGGAEEVRPQRIVLADDVDACTLLTALVGVLVRGGLRAPNRHHFIHREAEKLIVSDGMTGALAATSAVTTVRVAWLPM